MHKIFFSKRIKYNCSKILALLFMCTYLCSCSSKINEIKDNIPKVHFNFNNIKDDPDLSNIYDISTTSIAKETIVNYINMPLIHGKNDTYFLDMEKSFLPGDTLYEDFYKEYILELIRQVIAKFGVEENNFVLFITPNKSTVYRDYLGGENYNFENEDMPSKTTDFIKYIEENSNIKILYPVDELTEARKYCDTYYRLDSHWNEFGAYVGAAKLVETLGGEITPYGHENVFKSPFAYIDADCIPRPVPENFNMSDNICGILGVTDRAIDNGSVFRRYEIKEYGEKVIDGYALEPKDQRRLVMIDDSMGYGLIRPIFPYFRDTTFLPYASIPNADPKYLKGADVFVVEIVERNIIDLMKDLVELINKDLTVNPKDKTIDVASEDVKSNVINTLGEDKIN